MSAYDGAAAFFPALRLTSDGDGVTGDGGYVDDLGLQCLRANAESYNTISGTSMATPHVTGVAALVKAAHPSYTVEQLKNAIRAASTTCPRLERQGRHGRPPRRLQGGRRLQRRVAAALRRAERDRQEARRR